MASPPGADRRLREPNLPLKLLLDQVGWSPETLARKVNAVLERQKHQRRVHEKTPYRWLRGEIPHAPVPDVVVDVLSRALDHPVRFRTVWPNTAPAPDAWLCSDEELDVPWDHDGLQKLLGEWPLSMLTRRTFLILSGTSLTTAAWQWLDAPPPLPARAGGSRAIPPPLVSLVETMVTGAQQLDEQHGSAAADFVAHQFDQVSSLVREGTYDAATGRRLCASLAQLAQTSGWMAQEAAQDGRAQRWYLLGLRAARSASDPGLASSIMALMSNQAITLGKPHHALQLSEAAGKAAAQAPAVVQALIAARSTMAYANAGDRSGVEFGRARAAELINDADQISGDRPPWTSYVTATELDAICGRALIMLARHTSGQRRHTLINDAESLLRGRALDLSDTHRRSALRHSALLSRAYLRNGDLDQAVHTGHLALQRFPMVTSARCTSLLAALRTDLRPHAHRTSDIRDLVDELDKALPASRQRL